MHRKQLSKFVVSASLIGAGLGCSATPDAGPDEATDTARRSIVGGTPATDYPEAALIDMDGGGACSGTVIAPRLVLTAGHCVIGQSGWYVTAPYAGQSAGSIGGTIYDYTDTGTTTNPNMHDLGLVFLDAAITLPSYPTIADAPSPDGTAVVNIGRIQDGQFSSSDLFVSQPITIADATNYGFPYDYQASEVIQPGDSGGPDMLVTAHTIVSVNSGAGAGTEVLARVDLVHDWIQQAIADSDGGGGAGGGGSGGGSAGGGSGDDACGGITFEGACYGPVLVWCEGGLNVVDCGAYGLQCGWNQQQTFYDCL